MRRQESMNIEWRPMTIMVWHQGSTQWGDTFSPRSDTWAFEKMHCATPPVIFLQMNEGQHREVEAQTQSKNASCAFNW